MSEAPSTVTPPALTQKEAPPRVISPWRWVLAIAAVVVLVIAYYGLRDRYTPFTSEAYVQAYVTRIAPQVAGTVLAVHVADNQSVTAGQLLFELDPRPYRFAVDSAKAAYALAEESVAQLQNELDAANQTIEQTKAALDALPQANDKQPKPKKAAATSTVDRDHSRADLQATLRQTMAARIKVEQGLAAKVGDDNALIAKASAALNEAEYQLSQTRVVAPSDGYVSNLQLTVGTYIAGGTPVLTVINREHWWIVANFPENSLVLLAPGKPASVTFGLVPGSRFAAAVDSVGWGVGEGQGVPSGDLPEVTGPSDWVKTTQRFPVRLLLRDPDAVSGLRVGATATVVVYATDNPVLNGLGWLWLKLASLLNFLA